jgi:hypothetical protein
MGIYTLLGNLFIPRPWLALIPALFFGVLYWRRRHKTLIVAAATWLLYAVYEYTLYRRWLCSGECNIRVDLLLLYPALLVISLAALIRLLLAVLRRARKASESGVAA